MYFHISQIAKVKVETQDASKNNIFNGFGPKPGSTRQFLTMATINSTVPQVTVQASETDKLYQNNDRLVVDRADTTVERKKANL